MPLLLLAALLGAHHRRRTGTAHAGHGIPPVERLAITRVDARSRAASSLTVLNDGPDEVTIAQVVVDDAFWTFEAESWHDALASGPHARQHSVSVGARRDALVRLLTSTGVTFEREIAVAVETPRPNARFLGVFALIGLYVGVIPVALGLLWYPLMSRIGRTRTAVPAGADRRVARRICSSIRRTMDSKRRRWCPARCRDRRCSCLAPLRRLSGARAGRRLARAAASAARMRQSRAAGWVLAVLIAVGIGLHNFGEGLAIGSAFALGELALGTLLIVGFTLHNTTEGLAIVAPLARQDGGTSESGSAADAARVDRRRADDSRRVAGRVRLFAGARGVLSRAWRRRRSRRSRGRFCMQSAGDRGIAAYLREAHVVAGLAAGVLVMYVDGTDRRMIAGPGELREQNPAVCSRHQPWSCAGVIAGCSAIDVAPREVISSRAA